jgi:hypothetical protein
MHFYRRDSDGQWSHKAKNCNVSRVDSLGLPILDPVTANRDYRGVIINGLHFDLNYETFVGYFYVPQDGLSLG